jgi:hypothetical protein
MECGDLVAALGGGAHGVVSFGTKGKHHRCGCGFDGRWRIKMMQTVFGT